jgi:hypothetical protein
LTLGALAAVAASSSASNAIEPGVLGFLIVAALGVALVFLLRSMNKQLRKITPDPGSADDQDVTTTKVETPELPGRRDSRRVAPLGLRSLLAC